MLGSPIVVTERVAALHREAVVIDLHNDLLTKITHVGYDLTNRHRPAAFWNPFRLDIDIPKMREGGINALGCAMFAGFRLAAPRRFWRQLDAARSLVARHEKDLALVASAADLRAAVASKKIALFLGVEGSYVVEEDLDPAMDRLGEAGLRYLGPLWERDSRAGSSCRSRNDQGLTEVGRRIANACGTHKILLDVAHASHKTFWDLARVSDLPLLSSHSGVSAIHPHPRNLDDDQIREIAKRGGVVGVIFVSSYLKGTFSAKVEEIAAHIDHVAQVGGAGCVALGSDFDGFMPLARGMRDISDLPRLTQVLWDRGWREEALRGLLGENVLRLFDAIWPR